MNLTDEQPRSKEGVNQWKITSQGTMSQEGTRSRLLQQTARPKVSVKAQWEREQRRIPANWDLEADVVIIGAGAAGLPAAIKAADAGASVIVVEANYDIGGHAIISGGNVPLGGGTSAQKKYGIEDSPDVVFRDLTDWTIVQN